MECSEPFPIFVIFCMNVAEYKLLAIQYPLVHFSKLRPHSKIQFEKSMGFPWKITRKTDEIGFAHLLLSKLELLYLNRLLIKGRVRVNLTLTPQFINRN